MEKPKFKVRYIGPPVNLGTFGDIVAGAILWMDSYDWPRLSSDPRFMDGNLPWNDGQSNDHPEAVEPETIPQHEAEPETLPAPHDKKLRYFKGKTR